MHIYKFTYLYTYIYVYKHFVFKTLDFRTLVLSLLVTVNLKNICSLQYCNEPGSQ